MSEIFSRRPRSLVFAQGSPSEKVPVVDLCSSSDDEGLILDILWDVEFAKKLFDDLNRDVLGPPGDGKIIILRDSDELEKEVCEEMTTDTETAATSVAVNPTSTASTDADYAPAGGEKW
jgi:hypothetical protein